MGLKLGCNIPARFCPVADKKKKNKQKKTKHTIKPRMESL